ncbi:hypothetical protein [Lutibacter sp.]|uniref:hypothetical protein n=1 Tax=Lutibacter sp. TaxID=1925666 RepID=UPI0025C5D6A3|nr:hypothetical protein [Lutibacter sp.]
MNKDKVINEYQKIINEIDDLFEYRYNHYDKKELQTIIHFKLDKLTKQLGKINEESKM